MIKDDEHDPNMVPYPYPPANPPHDPNMAPHSYPPGGQAPPAYSPQDPNMAGPPQYPPQFPPGQPPPNPPMFTVGQGPYLGHAAPGGQAPSEEAEGHGEDVDVDEEPIDDLPEEGAGQAVMSHREGIRSPREGFKSQRQDGSSSESPRSVSHVKPDINDDE